MDAAGVRSRRQVVFCCGVFLFFFTSMSKVLVPGVVFDDLAALGFSAGALAALASGYMCTYSFSQLAVGIFSDRWGGARLLLFGGGFFAAGSLLFPLCSSYPLLFAARVMAGMGSGTVFLGVAKLIGDLYPERFALVFGLAMFLGYLGPITGVLPMTWLIVLVKWRWALLTPALLSLAALVLIAVASHGIIKPVTPGNSFAALRGVLASRNNWLLFGASSVVFGSYYVLLTVMGQKCLMDSCRMSRTGASVLITAMALLVALCNLGTGVLLKCFRGRRKLLVIVVSLLGVAGSLLGMVMFHRGPVLWLTAAAFVLVSVPAGFFSLFGLIVKELNPPERMGISVSMLNFFAFVVISASGPVAGLLLNRYAPLARIVEGVRVYPPAAYRDIFGFFVVLGAIGLCCCVGVPETRPKRS